MGSRIRGVALLACCGVLAVLTSGCNIFDFASDSEKTNIETAEDMIRGGDYQGAHEALAKAVKDSTDSHALYLDAKASLYEAGVDVVEIAELVDGQNAKAGDNLGLLEIIDTLSNEEKTAWYQANMKVAANLKKIFNQETTGPFEPSDIALEYTVSNLMTAILGLRDTNRDGIIDDNDFSLDLSFFDARGNVEGFSIVGGVYEDQSGITQAFNGLEVFLGSPVHKAAAAGSGTGMSGYEPDDINNLIVFVMYILENSRDALTVLLEKEKNVSSFDPRQMDEYLNQIASIINFYWYDDGFDTDGDGAVDEETINGMDDDGDGLVDEDSKYHPNDPTDQRNKQYEQIWREWKNK